MHKLILGLGLVGALTASSGCQSVLGLGDDVLDDGTGGTTSTTTGTTTDTGGTGAAGTGGAGGSTATSTGGTGTGGCMSNDDCDETMYCAMLEGGEFMCVP